MEKREPFALLVGMQTGGAIVANSMEVPQKLKIELLYHPVIPLLSIYPRKMKTLIQRDICTPMFIAAVFTKTKIWKRPKCLSIDEWIMKMCAYTNTHTHTQWDITQP